MASLITTVDRSPLTEIHRGFNFDLSGGYKCLLPPGRDLILFVCCDGRCWLNMAKIQWLLIIVNLDPHRPHGRERRQRWHSILHLLPLLHEPLSTSSVQQIWLHIHHYLPVLLGDPHWPPSSLFTQMTEGCSRLVLARAGGGLRGSSSPRASKPSPRLRWCTRNPTQAMDFLGLVLDGVTDSYDSQGFKAFQRGRFRGYPIFPRPLQDSGRSLGHHRIGKQSNPWWKWQGKDQHIPLIMLDWWVDKVGFDILISFLFENLPLIYNR